jgi:hypothetical protein
LDPVILTEGLPDARLEAGDVGWVVLVHRDGAGFEVEFVNLAGEAVAVVTVPAPAVPLSLQRHRTCALGGLSAGVPSAWPPTPAAGSTAGAPGSTLAAGHQPGGAIVARERLLAARQVEELFRAFAEVMHELPPDIEAGWLDAAGDLRLAPDIGQKLRTARAVLLLLRQLREAEPDL